MWCSGTHTHAYKETRCKDHDFPDICRIISAKANVNANLNNFSRSVNNVRNANLELIVCGSSRAIMDVMQRIPLNLRKEYSMIENQKQSQQAQAFFITSVRFLD